MTKILVIEDEMYVRENIEEILELNQYQVFTAENGIKGVKLAKNIVPDLIICDIMMSGLDGHGVLMELRADEKVKFIPIIFLTAKADHVDMRQAMELGADDYITKPFVPKELLGAVEARLARHRVVSERVVAAEQQTNTLKQALQKNQQSATQNQKLVEIKDDLLRKLSEDLRKPLSNINMAIEMLRRAQSDEERDRYLNILKEEYNREMNLLNQVESLQTLLTPDKIQLLQTFNVLDR